MIPTVLEVLEAMKESKIQWWELTDGGLGPHNLEKELHNISQVCGNQPICIDAETHLRSNDDKIFDLQKVREFLKIAKPWVADQ